MASAGLRNRERRAAEEVPLVATAGSHQSVDVLRLSDEWTR